MIVRAVSNPIRVLHRPGLVGSNDVTQFAVTIPLQTNPRGPHDENPPDVPAYFHVPVPVVVVVSW